MGKNEECLRTKTRIKKRINCADLAYKIPYNHDKAIQRCIHSFAQTSFQCRPSLQEEEREEEGGDREEKKTVDSWNCHLVSISNLRQKKHSSTRINTALREKKME